MSLIHGESAVGTRRTRLFLAHEGAVLAIDDQLRGSQREDIQQAVPHLDVIGPLEFLRPAARQADPAQEHPGGIVVVDDAVLRVIYDPAVAGIGRHVHRAAQQLVRSLQRDQLDRGDHLRQGLRPDVVRHGHGAVGGLVVTPCQQHGCQHSGQHEESLRFHFFKHY